MTRPDGALVALTGAGGFVGRAVASRLRTEGFRVVALTTGLGLAPAEGLERRRLPGADEAASAFRGVLAGATHLVHAGARNNADGKAGDEAYRAANVALTARLAAVAAEALPGRTVFLSSIRAVAGPLFSGEIADATEPRPADAYGRSKREGEEAMLDAFAGRTDALAILRLAPVYGPGMGGNLRALLRLADTPWPLPLLGLPGRRSLLGLAAAADAAVHLLTVARPPGPAPMLASDEGAPTLAEIASAMRRGLGRPARLVPAPGRLLAALAKAAGKADAWTALAASQACRPERLAASGWEPVRDSLSGIEAAARAMRGWSISQPDGTSGVRDNAARGTS